MALAAEPPEPRFAVVTLLGEGSHGTTFLARDLSARGDHVALTVLRARDDASSILARFDRARSALLTLRHPSISRIVDLGCNDDGRVYVATEFVPGVSHLALRPSKVRFTRSDERRVAKVLDFGLAAVIDDAHGTTADDLDAVARLLEILESK